VHPSRSWLFQTPAATPDRVTRSQAPVNLHPNVAPAELPGESSRALLASPCVVPVSADDALAWAEGRLSDKDLLLRSALQPEAVFIVDMPCRSAYREMCRQVLYWRRRGAVCLVARTGNNAVDDHFVKNAGIPAFKEGSGKTSQFRFFLPPVAFRSWLAKFSR
jgi:hypothetical protein